MLSLVANMVPTASELWTVFSSKRASFSLPLVALSLALTACGPAAAPIQAPEPAVAQPTAVPTSAPGTPGNADTAAAETRPAGEATITIQDDSVARYLVREQLARLNFPNDAVGETPDVSGSIAFNADGTVNSALSSITVDLTTLESDESRRDGYLRDRSLQSNTFPTAELVVRETPGLSWPLPAEGQATFQIVGDMTLHGVTRPLTWDVTAKFAEDSVSGLARTGFTFEDFDMDVPRVSSVLSVENNIRLEVDFTASVS